MLKLETLEKMIKKISEIEAYHEANISEVVADDRLSIIKHDAAMRAVKHWSEQRALCEKAIRAWYCPMPSFFKCQREQLTELELVYLDSLYLTLSVDYQALEINIFG